MDPVEGGTAADLGCGPGELTRLALEELHLATIVGVDNSPAMLASAEQRSDGGVSFVSGDIATWQSSAPVDVVIAAASLQWVPHHREVLRHWTAALAPGGQLAVQVPANAHAATHVLAAQMCGEEPYASAFEANGPPPDPVHDNVLAPDDYARILDDLGFVEQSVTLRVYPHRLANVRAAVEWVKGTTLTRIEKRLPDDTYARFLFEYEERLGELLDHAEPLFYPFSRILFWGRVAT